MDEVSGTVIMGCCDNSIYCFSCNGTKVNWFVMNSPCKVWIFSTERPVFSSPCIVQSKIVLCGSHDGYVYALDVATGNMRWKQCVGSLVYLNYSK